MSASELVARALKSGEWRERVDPKTQRKYYVHKATRRSVWNLAKELGGKERKEKPKEARAPSGATAAAREERHQRIQQCVEAEQELKKRLTFLETQKVELEAEVARLQAPVDAEEAQVLELQRTVDDKRAALSVVERERMDRRRTRDAELRTVQQRVAALQGVAESERAFRVATEERHRKLLLETAELAAEVEKEKTAADTVAAAARAAERDLERALVDAGCAADEVARREELVAAAEAELRDAAQVRSGLAQRLKDLEALEAAATEQLAAAEESLRRSAAAGPAGKDPSGRLMEQYQRKLQVRTGLQRAVDSEAAGARLEQGNARLRQMAATADRNAEALSQCARSVEADTARLVEAAQGCIRWCGSVH